MLCKWFASDNEDVSSSPVIFAKAALGGRWKAHRGDEAGSAKCLGSEPQRGRKCAVSPRAGGEKEGERGGFVATGHTTAPGMEMNEISTTTVRSKGKGGSAS